MYACNDIINFHLSSFFRGFNFRGSRSVREHHENLHPAKISHYTVGGAVTAQWGLYAKITGLWI